MKQKHYLVVGASSVAGQKAIHAILNRDPRAEITVTTSKKAPDSGEDKHTIYGIDLSQKDSIRGIKPQLEKQVDTLVFCPAFGMVGYPPELAPREDVESCFDFSVRPVLTLIDEINPQMTIGFSSYYWLHSLEIAYGSMAFAKFALEKLAVENPNYVRVVRAGLFPSKSLRGICLLIQRAVQKESFPGASGLKADWQASGLKFADFFTQFAQGYEKRELSNYLTGPYRGTESEDLVLGIERALSPDAKAIINVVGDSIWEESELVKVPDFMIRNKEAFGLAESFEFRHSDIA